MVRVRVALLERVAWRKMGLVIDGRAGSLTSYRNPWLELEPAGHDYLRVCSDVLVEVDLKTLHVACSGGKIIRGDVGPIPTAFSGCVDYARVQHACGFVYWY